MLVLIIFISIMPTLSLVILFLGFVWDAEKWENELKKERKFKFLVFHLVEGEQERKNFST